MIEPKGRWHPEGPGQAGEGPWPPGHGAMGLGTLQGHPGVSPSPSCAVILGFWGRCLDACAQGPLLQAACVLVHVKLGFWLDSCLMGGKKHQKRAGEASVLCIRDQTQVMCSFDAWLHHPVRSSPGHSEHPTFPNPPDLSTSLVPGRVRSVFLTPLGCTGVPGASKEHRAFPVWSPRGLGRRIPLPPLKNSLTGLWFQNEHRCRSCASE